MSVFIAPFTGTCKRLVSAKEHCCSHISVENIYTTVQEVIYTAERSKTTLSSRGRGKWGDSENKIERYREKEGEREHKGDVFCWVGKVCPGGS